jgi:membrane protein DedA with SNARE-associated domain
VAAVQAFLVVVVVFVVVVVVVVVALSAVVMLPAAAAAAAADGRCLRIEVCRKFSISVFGDMTSYWC